MFEGRSSKLKAMEPKYFERARLECLVLDVQIQQT